MPESVDILVAAENKASPVFDRVGADAERLGSRVKETGGKVKASSELVGTFANVLGNTQFGGVAGQLAQLTERVSQFSEVSKAGAAGALAFKLGLIGAAGVVTYKTTEIIASWWFEIDKAKQKADEAAASFAKMTKSLEGVRNKQFAQTKEDLSLIYDPAEREKATNAAAEKLDRQAREMQTRIAREKAEADRRQALADSTLKIPFVNQKEIDDTQDAAARAKQQLEDSQSLQQSFKDEASALRELVGARAKDIESKKSSNAAQQRSDSFVDGLKDELTALEAVTDADKRRVMAEKNAPKRASEAAELQERIDALKEEQSDRKRIEGIQDRELDRLEIKRIELERGKEAAKAYALQMEGLSEEFANTIAARESQLEAMSNKGKVDKNSLQAVEGRLLTRGPVANPVVDWLRKVVEAQEKSTRELSKTLRESAKDEPFVVKTVNVP